jgi:hypothetical protein
LTIRWKFDSCLGGFGIDPEAEHHSALVVLGDVAVGHPEAGVGDVEQDVNGFARAHDPIGRLTRFGDIDDQVEACRRVFASDTRWTVVRGSDLEEGESQGLPVWSRHVGDPILESNITRRVDFALFMVEALENDELVHEAPAIVGCQTPSALAYAA